MLRWRYLWPTIIFILYTLVVFIELLFVYGLKGIEWGQEGNFFETSGLFGYFAQYSIWFATLLAINPIILSLKLVNCGDGFFSLCLPSILGVVLNLLFFSILIFVINFAIVKFIERRRQVRMVRKEN